MADRQKYILVAEDDELYANAYKRVLAKAGYSTDIVSNGLQALEAIKKRIPDLLLLDLIMPVMDGFEVMKKLRDDNTLQNLKVIAVTNLGDEDDMSKLTSLGVTDYIVKSNVSIDNIVTKIKSLIG